MREQQVLEALDASRPAMIELLRELVNIDSGSYDKAGVDEVQAVLHDHLARNGIVTQMHPDATYGNCMTARLNLEGGSGDRPIVLMGHCDTVFPKGTAAQRPFRIDGDLAYGPGVADMKGGLVINTFVLEVLARLGVPACVVALYTADEEIASPSSRPVIEATARNARAVLNGEPGRPSGNVVTGRKGALFLDVEVTGKAAHSGVNHRAGASAIEALCRKVLRLHAMTDYDSGTTVNVGTISGGITVNTVAPIARASVDVRFTTLDTMKAARARVLDIVEKTELPGTAARIVGEGSFLPLTQSPGSKEVLDVYVAASADIGVKVGGEFTGGSADSGFTAAAGIPTLCATGPVGAHPHTPEEYLDLRTLVPRAQALALSVMRL